MENLAVFDDDYKPTYTCEDHLVYGGFLKWGYPLAIHFRRMFHYIINQPFLGTFMTMETPIYQHVWKCCTFQHFQGRRASNEKSRGESRRRRNVTITKRLGQMGVSINDNGGYPLIAGWLIHNGKSHLKMDENWRYPYVEKLPNGLNVCRNRNMFSLTAVVICRYAHVISKFHSHGHVLSSLLGNFRNYHQTKSQLQYSSVPDFCKCPWIVAIYLCLI